MVYCKKDQKADIDISREGKKMKNAPAYVKVYSRLKNEINKGTYPVGGFLPKEWKKSITSAVLRYEMQKRFWCRRDWLRFARVLERGC